MHVNFQLHYSAYLYYTYTCLQLTDVTKVGFVYMYSFVLKITILFVCDLSSLSFIHVDAVIVGKEL